MKATIKLPIHLRVQSLFEVMIVCVCVNAVYCGIVCERYILLLCRVLKMKSICGYWRANGE